MKILVFADSHGSRKDLAKVIEKNGNADAAIFLGDGMADFDYALEKCGVYPYGSRMMDIYKVAGNCDLFCNEPLSLVADFKGYRILITHGHAFKVKRGVETLAEGAAKRNCSAALFGHTHSQHYSKCGQIAVFNPGAFFAGSYGVIKIKDNKTDFKWKSL